MKLAALVEALSAIAKDHPEAEIVMSDGETAYNLRERPIAWSDFLHDGNGSVTLYYGGLADARSEEHTSELQSLMRISYAVFCLKKKHNTQYTTVNTESLLLSTTLI